MLPVMYSWRPRSWSRGASRTRHSLGLGLGLEKKLWSWLGKV